MFVFAAIGYVSYASTCLTNSIDARTAVLTYLLALVSGVQLFIEITGRPGNVHDDLTHHRQQVAAKLDGLDTEHRGGQWQNFKQGLIASTPKRQNRSSLCTRGC